MAWLLSHVQAYHFLETHKIIVNKSCLQSKCTPSCYAVFVTCGSASSVCNPSQGISAWTLCTHGNKEKNTGSGCPFEIFIKFQQLSKSHVWLLSSYESSVVIKITCVNIEGQVCDCLLMNPYSHWGESCPFPKWLSAYSRPCSHPYWKTPLKMPILVWLAL